MCVYRFQVLRIHTISSQKRIVAKTRNHVYSVPLNYPYKMCVVKKSGRGENAHIYIMLIIATKFRVVFRKGYGKWTILIDLIQECLNMSFTLFNI